MPDTATAALTEIDFAQPSAASVPAVAPVSAPPASIETATIFQVIARAASDPAVNIDKMERLIAMQERMEAKQAQVAFDAAMADAQTDMQPVRKDASNPQTRSRYATYAALDDAIRPVYTRHGFALSFNTADPGRPDDVRVVCTVSHRNGHRQEYRIDMPADGKGAKGGDVMTRTHATGSATSYGKRYLLSMIFNVAVTNDDDGNMAGGRGTAGAGTHFRPDRRHPGNAQTESLHVPDEDRGLVQGDGESQYKADRFKAAIAAGWKATNKTPTGRDNQILAYLDMAVTPDHIAAILKANEPHIASSERRDDINDSADRILQWFTDQAAKGQAA